MNQTKITLSVATIAAAAQAVHGLNANGHTLNVSRTDDYKGIVNAAMSGAMAQAEVQATTKDIVQSIRIDEEALSAKYAQPSSAVERRSRVFLKRLESLRGVDVAASNVLSPEEQKDLAEVLYLLNQRISGSDFTPDLEGEEFAADSTQARAVRNCYSNCHSACHGNRSWR